jgi:hypothetical protein
VNVQVALGVIAKRYVASSAEAAPKPGLDLFVPPVERLGA